MIRKEQAIYLIGALVLIAVLFFGFDNKPASIKALEKSRALSSEAFDIAALKPEAEQKLSESDLEFIQTLEAQLQFAKADSQKVTLLKQISGFWFGIDQPMLAGLYARQVAELENTGFAWSITGTTFASGLQSNLLEEKHIIFCRDQAVDAFEKAITLSPDVVDYRVNQALCYIEAPLADQPMKGIQMLAALADKYPESPIPPYHLARLAVRTGQYERAKTRIEQAKAILPEDKRIACLALDIYTNLGLTADAEKVRPICESPNGDM